MMKRVRMVTGPGDVSLRKRRHRQDVVTTFIGTFTSEDNVNLFIIIPEGRRGTMRNKLLDET